VGIEKIFVLPPSPLKGVKTQMDFRTPIFAFA